MEYTNDRFHNSQILHVTESKRITSKASSAIFFAGIVLCGSCLLPSHWASKAVNVVIAGGLFVLSNRLEKFASWTSDYEGLAHGASTRGYGNWLDASFKPSAREIAIASPAVPSEQKSVRFYDWQQVNDEAIGFVVAGNSGSAKTSIACWLAGMLTKDEPSQVVALDPHFNDIWEQVGVTSVGDIGRIERIVDWLLFELDSRCDRKGKKQPIGQPILVFADEINACLNRFSDRKKVTTALERIGSEARKFGITLIAINQSSNVDDIGISASMRNNFALVLLGASARSKAERWKDTDLRKQHINSCAYPCVLSGAIPDSVAVHPTHGEYGLFKKKGNPPRNLLMIRQLPLCSDIEALLTDEIADASVSGFESLSTPSTLVSSSALPKLSAPLMAILDYASRQGDFVSARKIQSGVRMFRDATANEIRAYFQWLSDRGYGSVRGKAEGLEFACLN
jgi:hypothetical protein